jgi:sortase A
LSRVSGVGVVAVLCFAVFLSMIGYLVYKQTVTNHELSERAVVAVEKVDNWPYPRAEEEIARARAYNQKLFETGPDAIGDAVDPFSGQTAPISVQDQEYQGLLNMTDDGMMARLRIPVISVDFGVWHTTGPASLDQGAGHLYGTSLPVGGPNTHSVLSAHSGMVDASYLSRLSEVGIGEVFVVQTMKETLGYKVDRIDVIQPDDFSHFSITPGEDRVTLMTCTPIGINTERLLVSGLRYDIPDSEPDVVEVDSFPWLPVAIAVTLGLALLAILLIWLRRRRTASAVSVPAPRH